ncbi:archaetidylserine decarboxylase [Ammoniphilus resinae]|uniref:Phosphatidylserine decarboxylase proenzyme n=1 Tax=Ammoniphilus resinae TaxID=861532 RepID=A0ABS4GU09_9BACL|nr:archaetidylserine decarboxylase [Ammoniphilus resinae]MBP1933743.1 phosphatidylserine decarboxylase [Ammoniphilus resinae]
MKDWLLYQLMRCMPTHSLSRLVGKLARHSVSKAFIPIFAKKYKISLTESEKELNEFKSLTDFFTRRLKSEVRPISADPGSVVSPADGMIAAFGTISEGLLVQAKGVYFSVWDLLGISKEEAASFNGGKFITVYLSPKDYHRVHSPIKGYITKCSYIPGTLFPVNAFGVRAVKGLFAKNERLISYIDSEQMGMVAVVKVGATIVGSVRVAYHLGATTNVKAGVVHHESLPVGKPINLGEEIGYFEFGSTVILVFEQGQIDWIDELTPGQPVKMGEKIAIGKR